MPTKALKFAASASPTSQSGQYATFPNSITIEGGTDYYSIEFSAKFSVTPSAPVGIIGRNGTNAGFAITATNQLAFYSAGSMRYSTVASFTIFDGNFHTYKLVHQKSGTWIAYVDGVQFDTGTYTTAATASPLIYINKLSNGTNVGNVMELAWLELQLQPAASSSTTITRWDAALTNGAGSVLKTADGSNDAALASVMPKDNTQWVGFDYVSTMYVGDGWSTAVQNYTNLESWYSAKKASTVYETAVCKGNCGSGFISMAATDFPGGALIKGDTAFTGNNHTSLAKRTRQVLISSNSGMVTMQDLWITDSNSGQPTATVAGTGNLIQRCLIEHTTNPGTNSAIAVSSGGGKFKNCIIRNQGTTSVRGLRCASTGFAENCVVIGSVSAIYTEWTDSKTINSFAVADGITTDCQNYPNGVPALNANNASTDATPATGTTTIKNVVKESVFVDFANNDWRIKGESALGVANIGAFFYSSAIPYITTIPKASLSLNSKAPTSLSLGWKNTSIKRAVTPQLKQLLLSVGWKGEFGKGAYSVTGKTVSLNLAWINTLGKVFLGCNAKQLSLRAGWKRDIHKSTLTIGPKSISNKLGWSSSIPNLSLTVLTKQIRSSLGINLAIAKQDYQITGKSTSVKLGLADIIGKSTQTIGAKPITVAVGTSIPFVGVVGKLSLTVHGKQVILLGTPFTGNIGKCDLNVTGKTISVFNPVGVSFIGLVGKTRLSLSYNDIVPVTGNMLELNNNTVGISGRKIRFITLNKTKVLNIARLYNLRF